MVQENEMLRHVCPMKEKTCAKSAGQKHSSEAEKHVFSQ